MTTLTRLLCVAAPALLLCGCLEVDQYPAWVGGKYGGKVDQMPYQVHFHGDRLAWNAAVQNRNLHQNEYNRARPPKANLSLRDRPRPLNEAPMAAPEGTGVSQVSGPTPAQAETPPAASPAATR